MKRASLALAALALFGCRQSAPEWPGQLAGQAGLCSAVQVLRLQQRDSTTPPASFDGFLSILHVGMIAAARGGEGIELRMLDDVSRRASVVLQEVRDQDWQARIGDCDAAFPETRRAAGPLPATPFEAGMMCFGLADFLARTAADFPNESAAAAGIADRALTASATFLTSRARTNEQAEQLADRYRAQAFLAGTPSSLLDQCARRFPVRTG